MYQTRLADSGAGTARHEELLLEHDGSCGEGLSSIGNLVVTKLRSKGGRVMVKLVRNIIVRVRRWRFIEEAFRREVQWGFGVEIRPRTQRLQEVIVGVVGVKV